MNSRNGTCGLAGWLAGTSPGSPIRGGAAAQAKRKLNRHNNDTRALCKKFPPLSVNYLNSLLLTGLTAPLNPAAVQIISVNYERANKKAIGGRHNSGEAGSKE
jgi:hypothetical protein